MPDEKAPVVFSARLPKATRTSQETADAWGLGFDVTIEVDEFAPISSTSATNYDSTGASRGGMYGSRHDLTARTTRPLWAGPSGTVRARTAVPVRPEGFPWVRGTALPQCSTVRPTPPGAGLTALAATRRVETGDGTPRRSSTPCDVSCTRLWVIVRGDLPVSILLCHCKL
ncbi:hypothetical protein [Micromonospora matsumotoense]|uniref:hypothetical protein n=1 Tax=Micromonospora matsumotoense TaxID=121616 RepID=UPI00114CDD9F|nr:hypothetical protein [Micromonospora matsumotoense]